MLFLITSIFIFFTLRNFLKFKLETPFMFVLIKIYNKGVNSLITTFKKQVQNIIHMI